jgi:hypothetical protein
MSLQYGIPKFYSGGDEKSWFPSPSANLTGTLTSRGRTFDGTDTKFLSELSPGDWVLDPDTDEAVRVERIESDTLFFSSDKFSSDVEDIEFQRIKSARCKQIAIIFTGVNGGKLRGITQDTDALFPSGEYIKLSSNGELAPILITPGTSSTYSISVVE